EPKHLFLRKFRRVEAAFPFRVRVAAGADVEVHGPLLRDAVYDERMMHQSDPREKPKFPHRLTSRLKPTNPKRERGVELFPRSRFGLLRSTTPSELRMI